VHIAFSPEQDRFRAEARAYFERVVTPEVAAGLGVEGGPAFRPLIKRLAADGWLGLGFPEAWGGSGATIFEELIFAEEAERAAVPLPHLTISTVGPLILRHGTDEQRERFIPGILTGETMFSIGYTEEGAGTDLAALKTRAVRDGDEYVITGQKLYTSAISEASYVWLAARTDPDPSRRHRGLSVFLVPTDAPGFSWTPIDVIGDFATSATYYENVRVPAENLVGKENGGWKLITSQLNRERVVLFTGAGVLKCLEDVTAWARSQASPDGRRMIDQEWVQMTLAEVRARTEFARLLAVKLAADIEHDRLDAAGAAANKVYATEHVLDCYRLLLELVGPVAHLRAGSPGAEVSGRIELMYRSKLIEIFGGGTNDVMRDFISTLGLGMPRSR
jgi:alkylation response protein AidB-like acyl-CoA dehydrogenase